MTMPFGAPGEPGADGGRARGRWRDVVVGKLRLRVLHPPGHTSDSMCLVTEDRVFSGDTLLIGATGRIDLPSGDPEALHNSLFKLGLIFAGDGFGVLSDIDVQRAMKDKLGADMRPYRILGACDPLLAHQALQAEPDIGLLPCNVIVREETTGRVVVGFPDPQAMVGLVGKPKVKPVADQAEQRLRRACASLGGSASGDR